MPDVDSIEVGYFIQSKKMWINNQLDLNDVWKIVGNGENVTLWCIGVTEANKLVTSEKRHLNEGVEDSPPTNEPTAKK